jgi:hypothetical protein
MADRKLASIQKIVSIDPIPDADAIEKATVLGWECVVAKKDNFKIGDLVVYIEVDSIVPEKPEFEFLRDRKFRVRTIKLRKQISQGLILPITVLPSKNYKENDDVTGIIGVRKYDPQSDLERKLAEQQAERTNSKIKKFLLKNAWYRKLFVKAKQGFPSFIKKTDEDRIQLFPHICENEKDTTFQVTEKIDGQSGTFFLVKQPKFKFLGFEFGKEYVFGVCSRNIYLKKPNNSSYWTIAKQCDIEKVLRSLIRENKYIILQGEIVGDGIQKNKYEVNGYDFYAFNLLTDTRKYNNLEMRMVLNDFHIKSVPLIDRQFELLPTIPEMVDYAKGKSVVNKNILREGLVIRNYDKEISFKVINPEFLLKYSE